MNKLKRQTGVALITAMLVTAIASVTVASMASRQHMDIRRTSNILDAEQAYLFALGAESYAKDILIEDKKEQLEIEKILDCSPWAN